MTPDLQEARRLWLEEQALYERLVNQVKEVLKERCQSAGLFAWVSGRRKETSNLLKKLITRGIGYHQVTDKAGARLVVRFREHLKPVESVIEQAFEIVQREDKVESLGFNKVGYQAIHYDVVLLPGCSDKELEGRRCEIQVRTLCQDLWAEMDHQLAYKPTAEVAQDVNRQIHLLNALLELADRQFSVLNQMVRSGEDPELRLLANLERHYYRFTGRPYDPEMAQKSIRMLSALYEGKPDSAAGAVDEFVDAHGNDLAFVYREYGQTDDPPLFLFQPEIYLILDAFQKDHFRLEEHWRTVYPIEELERVATMWGAPID